jgi:ethanolamine ammonia-lyase small subunit
MTFFSMGKIKTVTADRWEALRSATSARIALGRAGGSLPTRAWLNFKAAHAAARDAVHFAFDAEQLAAEIAALGAAVSIVESDAHDRRTFLLRPDLGRRLAERSRYALQELQTGAGYDLAIIVSDGLSALAAHRQTVPVLKLLLPELSTDGLRVAPIVVARFARVAIEDEIGQTLRARAALILIGERPGLGSPDSLGAYLVYEPRAGNTDAQRNCVSNIRPEGLPIEAASQTVRHLIGEALRRRLSGVELKDERALAGPVARGAIEMR